ncbi:IucA/IucC family protein, partial [Psychrobacter pygoscelis]|uniref:IucA/IucC family protein n=1 Tax=Psychrobacter pygoscelis TaxID=2488563 RepID=UPI00103AA848
ILAKKFRDNWSNDIQNSKNLKSVGIVEYLFKNQSSRDVYIFLDQWGSLEGHPFYPTWKSKPGLDKEDVLKLSPEFNSITDIIFTALHKKRACLEWMPEIEDISIWLRDNLTDIWSDWVKFLESNNLDPENYYPLPVHGWHLRHFVQKEFSHDIETNNLVIDGPSIMARPTMSFRTVLPCNKDGKSLPDFPLIKLPVAIWMTSERRSLQAKSIHMGPRISHVINKIMSSDSFFDDKLEIFTEPLGIIRSEAGNDYKYRSSDSDICSLGKGDTHQGRFLSAVFRDAKTLDRSDQLFPIPVASLLTSGLDGKTPIVSELIDRISDKDNVLLFWTKYLKTVLQPCIAMYLCYGIAFEAHQQNSLILFDYSGVPQKLLMKDFGDGRTYSPLLSERGYRIAPFVREGILPTTFDNDISLVRSFLIDACLICHLNELAMLLTNQYDLKNDIAWQLMAKEVFNAFDLIKDKVSNDLWHREYNAFLKAPWKTRSVLRMHLEGYKDYRVEHEMLNPLSKWIQ